VRDQGKKRLGKPLAAAVWLGLTAASLSAQSQIAITRISATAADARFQVDGEWFTGAALFSWPAGSAHTLYIDPIQNTGPALKTRYLFSNWASSNGPLGSTSNQVVITADPQIAWYNADLTLQYAVSLSYNPCPSQPPCMSPGTVWVNGVAYQGNADIWLNAGSTVALDAAPSAGYVFVGWQQGANLPVIYSFTLNSSVFIYPEFALARAIVLTTSPDGLQLLADRAPVTSPTTLEWGWNTTHTVGVAPLQRDSHGVMWEFQSWSDGGALNHSYQVAPLETPASLTAQFVLAVPVTLMTDPQGLELVVDGSSLTSPVNLEWPSGSVHTIAALPSQTDSAGGPWTFGAWSNGGTPAQTIQVTDAQASTGIRLTATYNPLSSVAVNSIPSGLSLVVDGSPCLTPCTVQKGVGVTVTIAAPASVAGAAGVRYDLAGWDGASGGVLVTAPGLQKVTARYNTMYQLTWSSRPANTGSWLMSPPSPDGYFPSNTPVNVTFTAATGWQFQAWGLDLTGTTNPASIAMTTPHAIQAVTAPVPAAPPAPTVVNAASQTATIAAGSIASLYGTSLASQTVTATPDPAGGPLPQTLGGITLECSGTLLPILYVSPQQINFIVSSALPSGPQTLEVYNESGGMLEVDFTISDNGPGLFGAVHADGTAINAGEPAQPGELITVFGTGFGAYQQPVMDGFPAPAAPSDPLVNSLEGLLASQPVVPVFAGAAPGLIGVAMAQLPLPADLTPGLLDVAVMVNGAGSNTLSIPVN
jgi:uncharacterized protein (TIGR03437 family)